MALQWLNQDQPPAQAAGQPAMAASAAGHTAAAGQPAMAASAAGHTADAVLAGSAAGHTASAAGQPAMAAAAAGHTAAAVLAGHSGVVSAVASKWIHKNFLPGLQGDRVPLELALNRREDSLTVLHVMAECLRAAQRTKGRDEQLQFPVQELLAIPGLERLVNMPVLEGHLCGKTPLIMLANTPFCAESPAKWRAEFFANWLVEHGADPDAPPGVALKYALGCANVFMVGCLLSAGASVAEAESRFEETAAASSKNATWKLWDFVLAASSAESVSVNKIAKMLEQQGFSLPANFEQRMDARPTRADHQRGRAPPTQGWPRPRSTPPPSSPQAAGHMPQATWPHAAGHMPQATWPLAPAGATPPSPLAPAGATPPSPQAAGHMPQATSRRPQAAGHMPQATWPLAPAGATPPSLLAPAGATPQAAGHMATPAAPSNLSTAAAGQWWQPPATWMPTWRHGRGAWRIAPLDDEDSDAQWVYDDTTNVYVWVAPRR